MHVGLDHEGVTPASEVFVFSQYLMPRSHHHLVDPIQYLRRQQRDIVLERLQRIGGLLILQP